MKGNQKLTWNNRVDSESLVLEEHLSGYQSLNLFTENICNSTSERSVLNSPIPIGISLSNQINSLAQSLNITCDDIFLAAFYAFLAIQTGELDVVIGEQKTNNFTTPTRLIIEPAESVTSLLIRLNKVRDSLPICHDILGLSKRLEVGDKDRHPVYQALFVGINTSLPHENILASLDIFFSVEKHDSELTAELYCDPKFFLQESLERFVSCYLYILQGFVANPQQALAELPCMSSQDENTLLVEWNQTRADFPRYLTLHRCFEQQVERTPDATALIFQHHELSYRELNHRANQLAAAIRDNYQHLHGRPLEPDTPIMLYLERSLEMVVG
ncbi:AMP-binding protein, partial [Pantoea stewartii]|uniref:AMP-binding protein n=1 Tax=Pantoea stewartii TaxID=66269 RepID=UPI00197F9953